MSKILYAIKTTKKYQNRIDSVLNTWLSDVEDYIFYSDHEDVKNNIIKVCDDDSYGGLEIKGLNFYNILKDIEINNGEKVLDFYEWLFMVDDDTFVNTKMLQKFVETADSKNAYGEIFTYETHSDNPMFSVPTFDKKTKWYSGGAGLLISSEALKKVNYFENYSTRHDDVSVGINLSNFGIELIDSNLFNSQPPEFWGETDETVVEKITYHHITEDKMKLLYGIVK